MRLVVGGLTFSNTILRWKGQWSEDMHCGRTTKSWTVSSTFELFLNGDGQSQRSVRAHTKSAKAGDQTSELTMNGARRATWRRMFLRTTSSLHRWALLLAWGWLLMTPRGPIIHEGQPVLFPTQGDCLYTANWLNQQAQTQGGSAGWYWCEEEP